MPNRRSIPRTPQEILEQFTYPEPMSGCWLWGGTLGRSEPPCSDPYGVIAVTVAPPQWIDGKYKRSVTTYAAHRASYEQHVGPIPAGLELDHLCRVHLCVNPDHLEPVTHQENIRRAVPFRPKEYVKPTHCAKGHPYQQGDRCPECNRDYQRAYHREYRARIKAARGVK